MATKDKIVNLEDLKVLSDHVEGEVTDLKSDINHVIEDSYDTTTKGVHSSPTGWRLNESDGLCSADTAYKLIKYAVTEGDLLKIVSDDRFQFQSTASVRSSGTPTRIGKTYGAGTAYVAVPIGAAYLILSTPVENSIAVAYGLTDKLSELQNEDTRLESELDEIRYHKTFTVDTVVHGFIGVNGSYNTSNDWYCTDYVSLLSSGDIKVKSTMYGNGGLAFYDESKTCLEYINGNNAGEYGFVNTYVPTERTVTVPTGAKYIRICLLIRSYSPSDMWIEGIGLTDFAEVIENMGDDVNANSQIRKNFTIAKNPTLELGNISITNTNWGYSSSTSRVRTANGETISLTVGDTIKLSDYSSARYYLGWKKKDGSLNGKGWLRDDFTVAEDGDYIILISAVPEATVESVSDLGDLLVITHYSGANDFVKNESLVDDIQTYCNYGSENVKSVNHRGYNSIAPENTLVAYKLSASKGFHYVETDVDYTSDGVLVCIHDSTINRTARNTDGSTISETIAIHDITYSQVLEYDFGLYKGTSYAGTKIPTFEQFIGLCKNLGLHPYIEIKFNNTEYTDDCIEIVKKYGMLDKVTWICGTPDVLIYLSQQLPSANLGYVVNAINDTAIANVARFKTETNSVFIDANTNDLTDATIKKCIDADIPLEVWTSNQESFVLSMNPYISGVTSDSMLANRVLYDDAIET